MNTTRKIARNTAILTIAEVVTAVINLFFTMYVARYLGVEGFGVLSFALAFTAIFGVFTDIGLSQLMTREVARDNTRSSKYLGNIAILKTALSVATLGLISLTINLMGYPASTKSVVYFSALFLIFNSFCIMFYSFFQAHERMQFVTFGRIFNSVLLLVGAFFAIGQRLSVTTFALIYFITSALTLFFNVGFLYWRFAKPKLEIDLLFWKEVLKQAWPFGLSAILGSVYFWIGSVMLSFMKGNEVVGWYNAAYRLVFALSIIPGVFFTATFPVMSKFFVTSRESLKLIHETSVKYMIFLAVPIAIGTGFLADKVIMLIFGPEYANSILALQILVWAVAFVFISSAFARFFESLNRQILVTLVAGSCAILNVVLNLVLIPRYSYTGASSATAVTEFTAMALFFLWSLKIGYGISAKKILNILFKTFIAGTVMGFLTYTLRDLTIWLVVPMSALVYFAALFAVGGINREDVSLLKQIVGRRQTL